MRKNLIIAATLSAFAMPAAAASGETPYALSAVHADFQAQLEQVAERSGEIGAAARAAAGLTGLHYAAEERLVLPLLSWAEAAISGPSTTRAEVPNHNSLQADISQLHNGDADLVTALVDLYAAAADAGDAATARLAERMIWHEAGDVEVLYPAALLVNSAMKTWGAGTEPTNIRIGPGPLYGEHPVPMMGVGDAHGTGTGN